MKKPPVVQYIKHQRSRNNSRKTTKRKGTWHQNILGTNDVVQFPRLVVEVLSLSTEARDRGRKLQCYLACPTIEEYVLIDSREQKIELYRKEPPKWVSYAFGPQDEVSLASIDVHFPVKDAYEEVLFAPEKPPKQTRRPRS